MVDRAHYDANLVPSLIAVSNADGVTPVTVWADPATHGLISSATLGGTAIPGTGLTSAAAVQIVDGSGNQITSFGGGTQYTDGGTPPAHPVAATLEFNNAGVWATVGSATPLPTLTTDGTNTANVLKSDGTAAGQNSQLVAGAYQEKASLTAASLNADLLASTDVSGYKSFSVTIAGTFSGTLTAQGSNDNTNFNSVNMTAPTGVQGLGSSTSTTGMFIGPINYRYLRIRMTAYVSGTATGTVELFTSTPTYANVNAGQGSTWTVGSNSATGSAVPANAFYMGASDGTNLQPLKVNGGDALTATNILSAQSLVYNGTNFDRMRQATAASNTTGTGLLGVGNLGYDGTSYQRIGAPLQTATASDTAEAMMLVGGGVQTNSFNVASVVGGTTYDVGNFASVKVQVTGQYIGATPTISFQTSNDGTNWFSQVLNSVSSTSGGSIASTTGTGIFSGGLAGRFFRLNFTGAYSSGSATGLIIFSSIPFQTNSAAVNTFTGSSTGSSAPAAAVYMGMLDSGGNIRGMGQAAAEANTVGTNLLGIGNLLFDGTNWQTLRSNQGDGAGVTQMANGEVHSFNGSTYDRTRNNTSAVVVAAGTTSTQTNVAVTTYNARALVLLVNITSGAGNVTIAINGTTVSTYSYNLLTSTALAGVATTALSVGQGLPATTNISANIPLPRNVLVTATVSGTIAFGIDANLTI